MRRRFGIGVLVALSIMTLLPVVAAAFPVTVRSIAFEGLVEIRERDVLEVVGFAVEDEVRESDLKSASQAIYDLGWFREVLPEVVGDGEVVFHVTEYPVIEDIEITGNVNKRSYSLLGVELFRLPIMSTTRIKVILRRFDIKKRKVLNRASLDEGLKEVLAEYNNRGYVLVGVGETTLSGHLSIEFVEGQVVGSRISGLRTVPTEIAEEMVDLPVGEFLLQMDLQRAVRRAGTSVLFSDVEVVPEPGGAADEVILHWTLTERRLIDEPASIDRIELEGVNRFSAETARDLLGDVPAGPVDNYELLQIVEQLYDQYQEAGYVMARFSSAGVENGLLRLRVDEGEVAEVLLSGNTKTRDHVVLRNLKIEAGDILTRRLLQTAYQRLSSFGYFSTVELLPEWADDGVRLAVIVTEKRDLGGMSGTLAVEPSSGGIVGELSIDQKNLLGTGQDLSLSYSRGFSSEVEPMTSSWTLGYSSVASFPGFDRVGVDLYRSIREVEAGEVDEEYVTVGGEVSFDYPVADYTDASISYKHEDERQAGSEDWTSIDSVGLALMYDTVDNPYFPTSGYRRNVSIEKAGGFAAGEDHTKLGLLWIRFTPAHNALFGELDQTVAVRFKAGWGNTDLPSTQAFLLGGPTTVRGTEAKNVSRMFVTNLEYRLELSEGLVFTTFFDAALDVDSVRLADTLASTGFEFGINAAGIYVRLEFVWVIEEDMDWYPVFDFAFGPMF
jgi:outer membrane protein insertion porin family